MRRARPGSANVDTDGDLIPDGCDRCPTRFDADYDLSPLPDPDLDGVPEPTTFLSNGQVVHWPQLDTDGDGRGDACDWDPSTPGVNDSFTNTNLEAEIVAHYPDLDDPPVLVTNAADANRYRAAFGAGRNEPVPTPRFRMGLKGRLPAPLEALHKPPDPPPLVQEAAPPKREARTDCPRAGCCRTNRPERSRIQRMLPSLGFGGVPTVVLALPAARDRRESPWGTPGTARPAGCARARVTPAAHATVRLPT